MTLGNLEIKKEKVIQLEEDPCSFMDHMKVVCENTQNTLYKVSHSETQDSLNHPNANHNDVAEYNSWLHFKVYYVMVFYMNIYKTAT